MYGREPKCLKWCNQWIHDEGLKRRYGYFAFEPAKGIATLKSHWPKSMKAAFLTTQTILARYTLQRPENPCTGKRISTNFLYRRILCRYKGKRRDMHINNIDT